MRAAGLQFRRLILATVMCLTCSHLVRAADEPALTKEQIEQFLLTAKVVKSQEVNKGITNTLRLTLTDGTLTHDAHFQSVDQHKASMQTVNGIELGFVDPYKYNIAAYRLAELLGLDDMVPIYVERSWGGNVGSFGWWLPVKMDEGERDKKKLTAPDPDAWNNQMYRVRVFDELVYDTDANLTNVLIGEDWKIWRIDFTRAFRLSKDLKNPKNLEHCDRQLFERLKTLDGNKLAEKTKHYLTKDEVKAVMTRRDKIVTQVQNLISEKGEKEVLY
jgi:hypothetical protein